MNLRPLAFLFLLAPLAAQEGMPPNRAVPPPAVTVSLTFHGGTIAEFVSAVRGAQPKVNIVVAADATDAAVPPMELREAGIEQALEGACAVAAGPMQIRMKDFRGGGEAVFTILTAGPSSKGQPSKPDQAVKATEVYSLNRLVEPIDGVGLAATTLLSAIEAAVNVDVDGRGETAVLRLHKESGLLIVRGRHQQLALAREVLQCLESDIEHRRMEARTREPAGPPASEKRAEKTAERESK